MHGIFYNCPISYTNEVSFAQIQLLISAHESWEQEKYQVIAEKVNTIVPPNDTFHSSHNLSGQKIGLQEGIYSRAM